MNNKNTFSKDDDQCILVDLIDQLAPGFDFDHGGKGPLVTPGGTPAPVTYLKGDGSAFVSNFVRDAALQMKPFLNITPAQLSLLVPKVQIFKMVYTKDEPKKFLRQEPFIFRDHVDEVELDRLFASGKGRLGNVGIESFDLQQIGKTSAVANMFQVNLTLFAESIEAFLTGAPSRSADYTSLITYNFKKKKKKNLTNRDTKIKDKDTGEEEDISKLADPTYFEIKAIVGWGVPKDKAGLISKELKKALEYSEMIMKLNLVKHDLSFNQDGTVRVTLEYKTRLESLMSSFRGDLFHKVKLKKEVENNSKGNPDEKKAEKEKQKNAPAERQQQQQISREQILKIYDILEKNKCIKFLQPYDRATWKEMREKKVTGRWALSSNGVLKFGGKDEDSTIKKLRSEVAQKEVSKQKTQGGKNNPATKDNSSPSSEKKDPEVPFVYLGDILEAAVALVQEKDKIPSSKFRYRVLIGPFTYNDRSTGVRTNISLGQIPVAMHNFNTFLNEVIISKGRTRMPLMTFLKRAVQKLAILALGGGCSTPGSDLTANQAMKTSVDMTVISHNSEKGTDVFKRYEKQGNYVDISLLKGKFNKKARLRKRLANKDQDPLYDYLVIYGSHLPTPYRDGNRRKDEKDGVYHYFLGRDRGIVKEINFNRIDMPAYRTYLMSKEAGPEQYLIQRYNADIRMVGFPGMSVGQLIHINPSIASLGDSRNENGYGSKLGITGYYFITRLSHRISAAGDFTTDVHAVGQGSFRGKKPPIQKISTSGKASSLDQGVKKNDKGPEKGPGPADDSPVSPERPNNLATASDAYAQVTRETEMLGIDSDFVQSPGSPQVEQIPPLEIIKSDPSAAFLSALNSDEEGVSAPRVPDVASGHVLASKFATLLLDYLGTRFSGACAGAVQDPSTLNNMLLDSSFWGDSNLMLNPAPVVTISHEAPLAQIQGCPQRAYIRVGFKYLTQIEHDVWDPWDVRGFAEDTTGQTWDSTQDAWRDKRYTFNCFRSDETGWYIYDFFENAT